MANLPKEELSQEIGKLAARSLATKLPRTWSETPLSGDTDFGLDYMIQLKTQKNEVSFSFYLQLKGTTSPKYNVDSSFISHSFKTSTLEFYKRQEQLVMVALVDLRDNEESLWKCPVYYTWLDDEWFDEKSSELTKQDSISVKIPTVQLLETSLNVFDFLSNRITEKFAVAKLKQGLKTSTKPVAQSLEMIAEAIVEKPILFKSIEEKQDVPWLHNPEGTYANELKRCSESLSANKLKLANRILDHIEQEMSSFTANELAEFHYQKANIYTLAGSYDLAEKQYKLANEADQKDRYRLGYIESKFKLNDMPSDDELKLFIEQLNNDSYHKCIIKAKCLVLLNKNEEALTLLRDNYPENIIGQMVVCTMSGMVDELHNIIDTNREREFQDAKDSYHFNSISARRCFYQATHGVISNEEILPIQGKVEYDLRLMQDAHSFSQKAWLAAKELGYPGDITILLDISILVYGYFDALPELIEHFDAILVERPNHPDLIGQYSRVLFNRSEYHRVIELIDNLEAPDAGDYGIKILSYYNLGKNSKVLELIDQHEEILLDSSTKDIQMIFCVAAEIAKELLNPVLSERYETIAKSFHDGEALVAIRKFVSSGNANPARKKELTQELYNTFIKLDKPNVIAEQLFRYLDAYEVESAKQVIELGEQLLTTRELTKSDYIHLAQAFMTTNKWSEANDLADKNISKNIEVTKWSLIKAAALQNLGKVGAAYNAIKTTIINDDVGKEQQLFYINLSLSLGLFENVIEVVKELYANTSNQNEKIRLLQILISVYSSSIDHPNELNLAIVRYGELVDQEDCEQEGQYLLYCLSTPSGDEQSKDKIDAFQARLKSYTQKFPNSHILKSGNLNIDEGAEALIKSMHELAGITDEQVEQWERNKRAIRSGSLPVPYSMLGHFLSDTRDIFTTWVFSMHYPDECLEYRINHAAQLSKAEFSSALQGANVVLIEETTLLVLSELELLDSFLENVSHFSLINSVFDHINNSSHQFGGTLYNNIPKKIMSVLQKHLVKLVLIDEIGDDAFRIYSKALERKNVLFLSEDLYLERYLRSENADIVCGNIFNLIESLSSLGVLDEAKTHEQVSNVCALGIFEPNMRMDFLTNSFKYYLDLKDGIEYDETGFKLIFNRLFEINRDSKYCFDLLFRMLHQAGTCMNLHAITLLSLFKGFLIRHPIKNLNSLIALWFVSESIKNDSESCLTGRNEKNHQLWVQYSELMVRGVAHDIDFKSLVQNVVKELFSFNDQVREVGFKSVSSCFIPMTQEAEVLEKTYHEFAFNNTILDMKR